MKKLTFCLFAALLCGMSLTVSSCKDDDNDNTSEQRNEDADPLDTPEAQAAWRWLCALTDAESLDKNWASQTYTPVIGQESTQNGNTRVVVVADIDEAKMKFSSFADVDPNELTKETTVSESGVGTLTWTPSAEGAENLAEVTVKTKLIPSLQKIVYCTQEQAGKNFGGFNDVCYYRFGDVVRDSEGYYWICVRPSHAPNKNDSHWINIFNYNSNQPIPDKNLYTKYDKVDRYNKKTIVLPTGLKGSREHVYNLSNLLWAMKNPSDYLSKGADGQGKGLGGFNFNLNGENFITAVADYWDEPVYGDNDNQSLYEVLFGCTRAEFEGLKTLNFFYKGYSWWRGNEPTLWCYTSKEYKGLQDYAGNESNDEKKFSITEGFDIKIAAGKASDAKNSVMPKQFTDDKQAFFLVRYKTGEQLMARGKYSRYVQLNLGEGGYDVYRFNEKTGATAQDDLITDLNLPNKMQLVQPKVGCLIGQDGNFYATVKACKNFNTTPVAMVVYYGDKKVEKNRLYNGLAMALEDIKNNNEEGFEWQSDQTNPIFCSDIHTTDTTMVKRILDGLDRTHYQRVCKEGHYHQPAILADDYRSTAESAIESTKYAYSTFFLPSLGQWVLARDGIGDSWTFDLGNATNGNFYRLFINNGLLDAGYKLPEGVYATTTESDWKHNWTVKFEGYGSGRFMSTESKFHKQKVRPFIAFRTNKNGTIAPEELPEYHGEQPPVLGMVLTRSGKCYATLADAQADGGTAVGMVISDDFKADDSYNYTGFAIGLYNYEAAWCSAECMKDAQEEKEELKLSTRQSDKTKLISMLDGDKATKMMEQWTKDHEFDAVFYTNKPEFAAVNGKKYYETNYKLDFTGSGWFMPSIGQWIMAYQKAGVNIKDGNYKQMESAITKLNDLFQKAGLEAYKLKTTEDYLTTTMCENTTVWTIGQKSQVTANKLYEDNVKPYTRFFVVFKIEKE